MSADLLDVPETEEPVFHFMSHGRTIDVLFMKR